jgi:ribosomal protein L7/L12
MAKLGYCKCCPGKVSNEAINCPHCGQPNPYSETSHDQELCKILQSRGKILAIKKHREITECGLAEAKKYVDSLEKDMLQ